MDAIHHGQMRVADTDVVAEIHNETGAPHFWFEQTGPDGERLDVLVVRATFDFGKDGAPVTPSEFQGPVALGDSYEGALSEHPLGAIVKSDGDLVPYKPGTDVIVTGHAHAPEGEVHTTWVAGIRVGPLQKYLRLHGRRLFERGLFGWRLGSAQAVDRVSLDYRLAYGGSICFPGHMSSDGEPLILRHPGNPAGCGWLPQKTEYRNLGKPARRKVEEWIGVQRLLIAPQIECARNRVISPYSSTQAQSFGAIARWWMPRAGYQGTFGDDWLAKRYPLLPEDFDSRYYQNAHADMVISPHLKGDEIVVMVGLLPEKSEMCLPGWKLVGVVRRASGEYSVVLPLLDTVRFDLDSREVSMVWRAHFDHDDPVREIVLGISARISR